MSDLSEPNTSNAFRRWSPTEPSGAEGWRGKRILLVAIPSLAVVCYSLAVLWFVATAGDVGIHCVFGPKIKQVEDYTWSQMPRQVAANLRGVKPPEGAFEPGPPHASKNGDVLRMLAGQKIENYTDYIQALRQVRDHTGEFLEVRWLSSTQGPKYGYVQAQRPPLAAYVGSVLWFLQEIVIYGIGAWVFWKRPRDDSARVFFGLCVVTVVAFMGGYHWGQIAGFPPLIFPFAAFVVFVPTVSLHFYLIFPRPNPVFIRHRRLILLALYAVPTLTALGLWGTMVASRWGQDEQAVRASLTALQCLALGYVGVAVVVFVLCLVCLVYSYYSTKREQRDQVRWILVATILSLPPIAWLLWDAMIDPARLGLERSAWPMYVVSLLYTLAYAFSITRYKLMRAEEILNRGFFYVTVSVLAGMLYSGVLVVGALIIGEQLKENQTSLGTVVACLTVLVLLILSGAVRRPLQAAIDRRFHREKYKFDQAMRKMSQAVGSLVDRATLGRRLLDAAGDVLRAEWGALYLGEPGSGSMELVACSGPEPDERVLSAANPLVVRLREDMTSVRVPHALSVSTPSDPAADAMISLGGEIATALESGGGLAGLMVLGPKRSGMPYENEEIAFLEALGSVAVLALRSADIQQTLEVLNQDLREKVDKIAEQQRRILILQDQLMGQGASVRDAGEAAEREVPSVVESGAFESIKGSGPAMRKMIGIARKVAASPSVVLIRGESGTGKELLAEAIHRASPRTNRPFVKVHCAALSQTLLESELFGHVKGAFTDAKTETHWPVPAGRWRHSVPRRNRRHQPGGADEAVEGASGDVVRKGRQFADDLGERTDSGGHAPGPRGADPIGSVPRGPVLSAQRDSCSDALSA